MLTMLSFDVLLIVNVKQSFWMKNKVFNVHNSNIISWFIKHQFYEIKTIVVKWKQNNSIKKKEKKRCKWKKRKKIWVVNR